MPLLTSLLPLRRVNVLPTPMFLRLYAPTSPRLALTPPEASSAEDASGGVNANRGDVGAYNLRNMGVGNTLTLLNGRRLVNSGTYQTELIGGDFVPTISANSNLIPVYGHTQGLGLS